MTVKSIAFAALAASVAFAVPMAGSQAEPISLEGVEWTGDPAKGKKLVKRCVACHVIGNTGKGRIGPSLTGVFGRTSGTLEGYKYSKAMKAANIVWSAATLDEFLTKPKKFVPKTKMSFAGFKKADQRRDLIAFLLEETSQ